MNCRKCGCLILETDESCPMCDTKQRRNKPRSSIAEDSDHSERRAKDTNNSKIEVVEQAHRFGNLVRRWKKHEKLKEFEITIYEEGFVYKFNSKFTAKYEQEIHFSEIGEIRHKMRGNLDPPMSRERFELAPQVILKDVKARLEFPILGVPFMGHLLAEEASQESFHQLADTYAGWLFRDFTNENIHLLTMKFGDVLKLENSQFSHQYGRKTFLISEVGEVLIKMRSVLFRDKKGKEIVEIRDSILSNFYVLPYLVKKFN